MIVVRILKILQPVGCILPDYDGYLERPEEGTLITTREPNGGRRIFTINLARNERTTVGLKVLLPGVHGQQGIFKTLKCLLKEYSNRFETTQH